MTKSSALPVYAGLRDARSLISVFKLRHHVLFTYSESADGPWGFEHWEHGKRIDNRLFRKNHREAESHFSVQVERLASMHNAHARMKPVVNRYYLPPGVKGVQTFDPEKRNFNRTIFDRYPNGLDEDDEIR